MGHDVQAFISSRALLERVHQQYSGSQVVELTQGLALLPLLDTVYDAIPAEEDIGIRDRRFLFLSSKIVQLIVRYSTNGSIGYLETNYFGGAGGQGAILANEGEVIYGPEWGPDSINSILRMLGVSNGDARDEFDAVGLGRFRSNEDWIEKSGLTEI
jgi:hypothetical protein